MQNYHFESFTTPTTPHHTPPHNCQRAEKSNTHTSAFSNLGYLLHIVLETRFCEFIKWFHLCLLLASFAGKKLVSIRYFLSHLVVSFQNNIFVEIYRVSQKKCGLSPFLSLWPWKGCLKNNSKNFGNKKNIRLFSKILSKWKIFVRKIPLKLVIKTLLSSTDPTKEQEDGANLEQENRCFGRSCLYKCY